MGTKGAQIPLKITCLLVFLAWQQCGNDNGEDVVDDGGNYDDDLQDFTTTCRLVALARQQDPPCVQFSSRSTILQIPLALNIDLMINYI